MSMNHREEEAMLKMRLADEFGMSPDSKRFQVVWTEAYETGHAYGYHEVENAFRGLMELIIAYNKADKME